MMRLTTIIRVAGYEMVRRASGRIRPPMTLCVERAEGVVHLVSDELTERYAHNAEEIEESLGALVESQ